METKIRFKLVKEAKSSGGDRYESEKIPQGETRPMTVYVPQSISRAGGSPCTILEISIEPV